MIARPDPIPFSGSVPAKLDQQPIRAELGSMIAAPWWTKNRGKLTVDGRDHSGKTTIASFIAWQYSIPVIYMDFFLVKGVTPARHNYEAIASLITRRHELNRPVIVEGIKMLEILENVGCKADFLVVTENTSSDGSLGEEITEYARLYRPNEKANFTFRWAEHG